jgi:hypothetical protein
MKRNVTTYPLTDGLRGVDGIVHVAAIFLGGSLLLQVLKLFVDGLFIVFEVGPA